MRVAINFCLGLFAFGSLILFLSSFEVAVPFIGIESLAIPASFLSLLVLIVLCAKATEDHPQQVKRALLGMTVVFLILFGRLILL